MKMLTYESVGLKFLVYFFKFFGFYLCPKTAKSFKVNYFIILFGLSLMSFVLLIGLYECKTNLGRHKITFDHLCRIIGAMSILLSLFVHYLGISFTFKTIQIRVSCLVTLVNECIQQPHFAKSEFLSKSKILGNAFTFINAIFALNAFVMIEIIMEQNSMSWIYQRISQLFYTCWMLLVVNCFVFLNLLLVFLCYYLSFFVDFYMRRLGNETVDVKQHQIKHQKVCLLIQTMNKLFSNFMMSTLVFELLTIVAYTRGFATGKAGIILNTYLNVTQILMFVLKNIACSTLNKKVRTSVSISLADNWVCSAEHINYILYMKQLLNCRPEITYGDFFPISRMFIFSVFGTAISYAMILRTYKM